MPTYNRAQEIKESIQSVLNQTYEDLELIVINDGGTDETEKIINNFNSSKIIYCKLKENKGLSGALNEGIIRASGKYIAYLDDDDIYYPGHIETLVRFIEENPENDCVYSHAWWCFGDINGGSFVEYYRNENQKPDKFDRAALGKSNYISTLNILHRKSCLLRAGLFNEDLGKLMDWELWMRLSKYCSFHQIDEFTGEYRWKQNNMSVEDRLDVEFLNRIVKSFYEFREGRIAFAGSYIKSGMRDRGEEIFGEIVDGYEEFVKTPPLLRDMFLLSRSLRHSLRKSFQVKLARDFFDSDPRVCLKEIFSSNSSYLMFALMDLLIIRIYRSANYRTSKFVRSFFKR
jgi:glycosyltransferase involved in cell wall biosynthesis